MRTIPTLSQLYTNVVSDLNAEFGVNISLKKKVALRVQAAVHAGKLWLCYKYIGFAQKQIWPDTADSEFMGGTLERFGRSKLGRNPKQAVAGNYTIQVTGTIGSTIPALQLWKSNDDSESPGYIFQMDAAYILVSNPDTITVRALTPGVEAKLNVADTLTATSPIAGVDKTATVTAITVLPLAAEDLEDYRTRIVEAFRLEATGGAAADYKLWAQDAQGVKRVYPYAKTAETNANNIFIEATPQDSTDGKGTPPALMITDVENVINFNPDTSLALYERGRKPLSVINYYLPVTIITVDIEVNGTGGAFTAAQKSLILQALTESISNIRPHVDAADVEANRNDVLDTQRAAGIIYAQVPGANYTGLTLKFNTVALQTYHFTQGNIPYLNTVTYP
jgi:hypothetical protein